MNHFVALVCPLHLHRAQVRFYAVVALQQPRTFKLLQSDSVNPEESKKQKRKRKEQKVERKGISILLVLDNKFKAKILKSKRSYLLFSTEETRG